MAVNIAFLSRLSRKWIVVIIVGLVIVGGFIFIRSRGSKQTPLQFSKVKRQDIAASVAASGVLSGVNTANIKFKTGGKLASIQVKVGDTVSNGQLIATLDQSQLYAALQQAQYNLRQADATLANIYDQVQSHAKDETFAQRDTRTKAEVARDDAYQAVVAAQQATQDAVVTAPIAGTVTQVSGFPGQVMSVADVVAQVVDTTQIYFDADVDEADLAKVAIGQRVNVTLNAYPDQTFNGTVSQVLPQTHTTTSGATVVTARINLWHPNVIFAAGLNGQASIVQDEAKDVITIPQEALLDNNTVYVKNSKGNGVHPVPVTPGLRSDIDVQIKQGLSENDVVVTNPEAVVKQKG